MASASAPAAIPHRLVLRPPARWTGVSLREIWEYRELLYFLAKREVQIRYKQSVLGIGWAVLQPLALTFVFAVFFGGTVARLPSNGLPYAVFALAGLAPWLYVSTCTSQAAQSLVTDSDLLSKVYFPRLVIPLAKVLSFLIDLGVSLATLIVVALAYNVTISANIVFLPAFLLLAVITAIGVGSYLAALNVKYRDVSVVMPILVQLWFFVTPVIYPSTLVTGGLKYVYALNPMVSVTSGVRWSVLGTPAPGAGEVAASIFGALAILAIAIVYFRRAENFFADVI